jgi:hypothetical protein
MRYTEHQPSIPWLMNSFNTHGTEHCKFGIILDYDLSKKLLLHFLRRERAAALVSILPCRLYDVIDPKEYPCSLNGCFECLNLTKMCQNTANQNKSVELPSH